MPALTEGTLDASEEQEPTGILQIRLFGAFEILVDRQPVSRLRSRAGQGLLALLVLRHDRNTDRNWLAATLWPDSSDEQALYNLRRNLTDLRGALGAHADLLVAPTPRTVRLGLDGTVMCDLIAFDRATERLVSYDSTAREDADERSLTEAVVLYRGPLLEECREEWIVPERALRERRYCSALQALADRAIDTERIENAVYWLRRLLAVEPLRESAARSLMEALAKQGDHAASAQVYRQLRVLMHDEMNAQPGAETTALYRHLRSEARQKAVPVCRPDSPSPTPLLRLPAHLTSFIGRDSERQQILSHLESARLLTLTGSGGVGKTRLAAAVAEEVADEYRDGVCFVDLAPLQDPAGVAQAVASALELREAPGRPLLETLLAYLRERSLLLILDNCEHLCGSSASLVEALLAQCRNLRFLATSRERIGAAGERAWRVPSLSLPEVTENDSPAEKGAQGLLMESEAAQLFVERAIQANTSFRLTRENLGSVSEICLLLDGIPLALEFAAAWVRVMPVEQTLSRLKNRLDLLQSRQPGRLARHQTLRATLDWSYGLLSGAEQRLLGRLSVFVGGWCLEAAEAICNDEGTDADSSFLLHPSASSSAVLMGIAGLIDKSLVLYTEQAGQARYRLLETTRQYAAERLQESGAIEQVRGRHRDWFLALAEEAVSQLMGPEQAQWLQRLETEHDNFRAALAWCGEEAQGAEAGLRLAGALSGFWTAHGHLSEGRACLAQALAREGVQARTAARANAIHGAGSLTHGQGNYASARVLHEESLAIRRELGDRQGIANSLSNLGSTVLRQGDYVSARALHEESLAIQTELGNRQGIANSLIGLGVVATSQGDYAAARSQFEQSLALCRVLGNRQWIAHSLNGLGNAAYRQGEYELARSLFEQTLASYQELGNRQAISNAFCNLANVAKDCGEYESAQPLYEQGLAIQKELGDRQGIANSLGNLATVAKDRGEYASARPLYEQGLAIQKELGDRQGIANSLSNLAHLAYSQGECELARSLFEEGLAVYRELGDRQGIASSLCNLGSVATKRGEYASARVWFRESLALQATLRNEHSLINTLEMVSELAVYLQQPRQGVRLLAAVAALNERRGPSVYSDDGADFDSRMQRLLVTLDEETFAQERETGSVLTMEEAVALAYEIL